MMNNELLQKKWDFYKEEFFKESSLYQEKYKWDVLMQVSDKWDWSADDKAKMFKEAFEIKGSTNLWTSVNYYPITMASWFLNDFPKETLSAFNKLFDETEDLLVRLSNFRKYFDSQLKILQAKYPDTKLRYHSQDIRSMSLYLFLQNPEKYSLFKFSFVKKFAERFNFGSIKKGQHENYITYLKIVEEIKKDISSDTFIKEYHQHNSKNNIYLDNSLNLLIQDFMYCSVSYDVNSEKRYWLYSPGEGAYKWNEFFDNGIIALGWDELEDLNSYENREEINRALHNSYGGKENKPNDTTANDEFINSINVGDIIIVKRGRKKIIGYGEVISDYYYDDDRDDYKHCRKVNWKRNGQWEVESPMAIKTLTDITNYDSGLDDGRKYHEYLISIMNDAILEDMTIQNPFVNLLRYKKQIILQGPPGTGKTREAKIIAKDLIVLTEDFIAKKIYKNLVIPTVKGQANYTVLKNENSLITLEREKGTVNTTTYSTILSAFSHKKWNNEIDNNDDRMAVAIAKFVYDNFLVENYQFKLIQFHPSYTYEDFVRGIVAKPNTTGEGIVYVAENKIIGDFAKEALKNYLDSKKVPEQLSKENWVNDEYVRFKEELQKEIDSNRDVEVLIKEGTKPKIIFVEADALRVNRYSNEKDSVLVKDSDIINGYLGLYLNEDPIKIKDNALLSKSARSGMYYLYQNLVEKFKKYLDENSLQYIVMSKPHKIEEKPYILVIDEVNRANLSSVLGEMIYALEYRGEEVESMYEVDGSQKLILPPNLYIIGTMNTADRSVGHIDYAIRRRFAFVDVLPKDLTAEMKDAEFYTDLFFAVKSLFTNDEYQTKSDFISQEFEPKDMVLGHSYFIDKSKNGGDMKTRWNYEIKPILLEYVRDGVLKESALKQIASIENTFDMKIE